MMWVFPAFPCWHKDKMLCMISRRLLLGDFGSALKARCKRIGGI